MLDINERLNNFENRLLEIEVKLGIAKDIAPRSQTPAAAKSAPFRGPETTPERPGDDLESAPRKEQTPKFDARYQITVPADPAESNT